MKRNLRLPRKPFKKEIYNIYVTERLRKNKHYPFYCKYICLYNVLNLKDCICFYALVQHFKIKINGTFCSVRKGRQSGNEIIYILGRNLKNVERQWYFKLHLHSMLNI